MAILNILPDQTGLAGVIPSFVYINTDNTVAQVTAVGFLNDAVAQGLSISDTDLAIVVTKTDPGVSASAASAYAISHVGGNYSLINLSGAGAITNANNLGGLGPTIQGLFDGIIGTTLNFKSLISGTKITFDVATNPGAIIINSSATDFDPAFDYDGSGPGNPSITGDWFHQGGFIVEAGAGDVVLQSDLGSVSIVAPTPGELVAIQGDEVVVTAGTQPLSLSSTANNVLVTAGVDLALSAGQVFSAQASGTTLSMFVGGNSSYTASAGQIEISALTLARLESTSANVEIESVLGDVLVDAPAGDVEINAVEIRMPSLFAAVTANAIYYDSITGQLSFGAAGGGSSFAWNSVAGVSQALVASNGYIPLNAGTTTFTVPALAAVGDEFEIAGSGSCQWIVAANLGQSFQLGVFASTVTTGEIQSTDVNDGARLVCIVANTRFYVKHSIGNLNLT